MQRKNILRVGLGAVTMGLLIFLALNTPLPSFAAKPLSSLSGFLGSLFTAGVKLSGYRSDQTEVSRSQERVEFTVALARERELQEENEALRKALGMGSDLDLPVIPAATLGFLREGRDEFILIGRGLADGLREGAPVLDEHKVLAGSVASAEARVAKVKLLTSPSSAFEVVIEPGAQEGGRVKPLKALARGANVRQLEVDLVPQGTTLAPGDLVLATRNVLAGRVKRFLVGEVREIRNAENQVFIPIRALHLFDPFTSETVFVVLPVHE